MSVTVSRSRVLAQCIKCNLSWKTHQRIHSRFLASSNTTLPNHYKTLGVDPQASQNEIRTAFVSLSKECHPDKNLNDPKLHEKFVSLNEAYTTLSKPLSRKEYDMCLAYSIQQHHNLTQYAYSSHTPGAEFTPGSSSRGFYEGQDTREFTFKDKTIFEMRDKTQDSSHFYPEDRYYGVKGVKKLPNSYIVAGCIGILAFGTFLHYLAFKYSTKISLEVLDRKDRINNQHLKEARARALMFSKAQQIELLEAKMDETSKTRSAPKDV